MIPCVSEVGRGVRGAEIRSVPRALSLVVALATSVWSQDYRRADTEFSAKRAVSLPSEFTGSIAVTQFFHHGQIDSDGANVLVFAKNRKAVPTRVLQIGPGDYCRLAFQTTESQRDYEIFYGGDPPAAEAVLPWTDTSGLLLETRQYQECNLNSLESLRAAFESSPPIGADYVDGVYQSHNPFTLRDAPFLSRYSGALQVSSAGTYGLMTSSQDCSFLLIDDKLVASAPGRHAPMRRVKPEDRHDVRLSAGPHKFEYYHAATSPTAMMVAAWEPNPTNPKPRRETIQIIPPQAFRAAAVGRVPAGFVETRQEKTVPDFLFSIGGSVPLPDNPRQLIGVQFVDNSPRSLTSKTKLQWDFGDGQTSSQPNPNHVYLQPGLYTVTLTIVRGLRSYVITNRVYIDQPRVTDQEAFHKLENYLPLLETYDAAALDAESLRQLVAAYVWKADVELTPQPEEPASQPDAENSQPATPVDPHELAEQQAQQEAERKLRWRHYVALAVAAGQVAFLEQSAATGDESLIELARLIGPMARDQLGDSRLAGRIWFGASGRIGRDDLRVQCETEAADVLLNDMGNVSGAKGLLDQARARLGQGRDGPVASHLLSIWGDYQAARGDGPAARQAYREAGEVLASGKTHAERTAWQGAHSRSVEQFLKSGRLDRAAEQLRAWRREFPEEKIDGYQNLLFARYWAQRGQFDQAVALADQLLVANPNSPYIDQLLLVSADCDVKRNQPDRALATLRSILKDYPGSPLVPVVRENIAKLEGGGDR